MQLRRGLVPADMCASDKPLPIARYHVKSVMFATDF
jgi:hypothetical protein